MEYVEESTFCSDITADAKVPGREEPDAFQRCKEGQGGGVSLRGQRGEEPEMSAGSGTDQNP